jgi:hypothetical protein
MSSTAFSQNSQFKSSNKDTIYTIDVGIDTLLFNWNHHDTTGISRPTTCRVILSNRGATIVDTVPLNFTLLNSYNFNETWTGILAPGDTVSYLFTQTYHAPVGYYNVCVELILPSDDNSANDKKCQSLVGINDLPGFEEIEEQAVLLEQNQPNPASGEVSIKYYVRSPMEIRFELTNSLGQLLHSENYESGVGEQIIHLNVDKYEAGIYYYSLKFKDTRITRKMVIR